MVEPQRSNKGSERPIYRTGGGDPTDPTDAQTVSISSVPGLSSRGNTAHNALVQHSIDTAVADATRPEERLPDVEGIRPPTPIQEERVAVRFLPESQIHPSGMYLGPGTEITRGFDSISAAAGQIGKSTSTVMKALGYQSDEAYNTVVSQLGFAYARQAASNFAASLSAADRTALGLAKHSGQSAATALFDQLVTPSSRTNIVQLKSATNILAQGRGPENMKVGSTGRTYMNLESVANRNHPSLIKSAYAHEQWVGTGDAAKRFELCPNTHLTTQPGVLATDLSPDGNGGPTQRIYTTQITGEDLGVRTNPFGQGSVIAGTNQYMAHFKSKALDQVVDNIRSSVEAALL